jgi:hypothetical protein
MAARVQFTIARLLATTTLVAVAVWVANLDLPVTVHVPSHEKINLLPYLLAGLLLAAAVGVLFKGRPGAREGVNVGCAIFLVLAMIAPLFFALRELYAWVAMRM